MASSYAWHIDGRKIAILKKYLTSTDGVTVDNTWRTPDVAESQAIMFEYTVKISAPTTETSEIDVNDYLALAIVDYVKYRLAEDEGDYLKARIHYKQFKIKMNEDEDNKRGGPVVVAPARFSLR